MADEALSPARLPESKSEAVEPSTADDRESTQQQNKTAQQRRVNNALNAVSDFEKKWKEFQNLFQQMNEALVSNLSRAFGVKPEDLAPVASEEERKIPFGGKQPSAREIAQGIQSGKYQKIVVLCGAGMSTSAGIPDFRSPDTGVYAQLKKEQEARREKYGHLTAEEKKIMMEKNQEVDLDTLPTPEDLFTLDFYRQNQRPFILRAGHMWPGKACEYRPTPSHCFLKLIEKQLLRVYTQNIDELETWNGLISREKVRRCHGSFERVHCTMCDASFDRGTPEYEKVYQSMVCKGKSVPCWECAKKNPLFVGVMKPGIVFFGEAMSEEFHRSRATDFKECDLVIVMGTSLMVQPFSTLPERVGATVPRLLINGEVVGNSFKKSFSSSSTSTIIAKGKGDDDDGQQSGEKENYRDAAMIGDLDTCVSQLSEWMGRRSDLQDICKQFEVKRSNFPLGWAAITLLPDSSSTQSSVVSKSSAAAPSSSSTTSSGPTLHSRAGTNRDHQPAVVGHSRRRTTTNPPPVQSTRPSSRYAIPREQTGQSTAANRKQSVKPTITRRRVAPPQPKKATEKGGAARASSMGPRAKSQR